VQDYADQAIANMRSPKDMSIICVDVTNKCDLHCSNCTRLLENQTEFWDMTPDNFRLALRSLKGFTGVIAMIGGNPCVHKNFPDLCRIFVEEIPVKRQRGLWTNNAFKYQELIKESFGFFNLNPHNSEHGLASLKKLKELIPEVDYFKGHSHHAPLLTAMRDLYPDQGDMWELIQTCDINRDWSATLIQNKGELRAYFCEVAASFDLARGEDHGYKVTEGWWNRSISEFSSQVKHFCPGCGVPARLKGHLDHEGIDTFTPSNADLAAAAVKRRRRQVVEITSLDDAKKLGGKSTNYNQYYSAEGADVGQSEGVVGFVYKQDGLYQCLPSSADLDMAQSLARFRALTPLPDFVSNVIGRDHHVLFVGAGYSADVIKLARKANHVLVLEPDSASANAITLAARLNECGNVKAVALAAYDQNATAEFAVALDSYDGVSLLAESGDIAVDHYARRYLQCVRIDDYFAADKIDIMVMTLAGHGDLPALSGAVRTLAKAPVLFLNFGAAYYGSRPDHLTRLATLLRQHFNHCYAPVQAIRDGGDGFAPLLQALVDGGSDSCLLLSKAALI